MNGQIAYGKQNTFDKNKKNMVNSRRIKENQQVTVLNKQD